MDVCYALFSYNENIASSNSVINSALPISCDGEYHILKPGTLVLTFIQNEKKNDIKGPKFNQFYQSINN